MEEVHRRRTERTRNKLAMPESGVTTGPRRTHMNPKLSASMPTMSGELSLEVSADLVKVESSESSLHHEKVAAAVIPNRGNQSHSWQIPTCLGALELASELEFDYKAPLKPRRVAGREDLFKLCLEVWKEMKLAVEFYQACMLWSYPE